MPESNTVVHESIYETNAKMMMEIGPKQAVALATMQNENATALQNLQNTNATALANLQNQAALDHLNAMRTLQLSIVAKRSEEMAAMNIEEALGFTTATRDELGKQIAGLNAAVAAIQQMIKAAQTTPPVTGEGVK